MSDDTIATRLRLQKGRFRFRNISSNGAGNRTLKKVFYAGVAKSRPAPGVLEAIGNAAGIIICPSNPVTSIGPILAVPGIRMRSSRSMFQLSGVSPMIGESAISGPAHKLMAAQGMEPSALGAAKGYADFLDQFVIDSDDEAVTNKLETLGIES